jgi:putative membrane protein
MLAVLAASLTPAVAFADDADAHQPLWLSWDFSAGLVIPAAAALLLYWRGLEKRPGAFDESPGRHLAFLGGVCLTFASLASPIDAMSDHLFCMHQVQHMLLRMVGPMLIAYAQPGATLVAGSPNWLRRGPVRQVLASGPNRKLFGFLVRPWPATLLFVASLYVWQWPPLHNRAIVDDGVHDLMHATMLAAGLLFFWRVFDQRPPPKGASYGARLMMVWIGTLANIPIGAFTCLKSQELYPAYDTVGRLFGISPLDDERLGGFIMWAPSSMMMLIALLLVVHAWGGHEERVAVRAGARPAARRNNGALAIGLVGFSGCILAATVAIALIANHWTHLEGRAVPVQVALVAHASSSVR